MIADGSLTTLSFCWRIERSDGAGLALTSHDSPVTSQLQDFAPAPGIAPSAIIRKLGLDPHSGEVAGALTSDALNSNDLALGRWDGARVALIAIDWERPGDPGAVLLAGELGEVTIDGESFSAELRGAAWRLDEAVCPSTSAECRAELGDEACRVDLAGRTQLAAVVAANGNSLTLDRSPGDRFRFGRLRYLTGANCGLVTAVLAVDGAIVTVRDSTQGAIEPGTRVELREGCDKRFATCASRFANAANFRGEPHLPGNDLLTRYPGG